MRSKFKVFGGFPIAQNNPNLFSKQDVKVFWKSEAGRHGEHVGCYVFYRQAGLGATPLYVGQATKSFKSEVFQSHKMADHYTPQLYGKNNKRIKGTYHILFLQLDKAAKGDGKSRMTTKADIVAIDALEQFLIKEALKKNPNLSNVHFTGDPPYSIETLKQKGKNQARASYNRVMGRDRKKRTK